MSRDEIRIYSVFGAKVGMGHDSRSRLLQRYLPSRLGVHVEHLRLDISANSSRLTGTADAQVVSSVQETIANDIVEHKPIIAILDLPWWESDFSDVVWSDLLPQNGSTIVGIDGPVANNSVFDLVFIPSFLEPEKLDSSEARIRFGWDCYLLPNRGTGLDAVEGTKVVVSTGGSDVANLGDYWPKQLVTRIDPPVTFDWIQGPLANAPTLPPLQENRITVHFNSGQISHLIGRSNFGLAVFGVSFFEMLATGLSTVVYSPYADRTARELEEIRHLGIARVADSPDQAVEELRSLVVQNRPRINNSRKVASLLETRGEEVLSQELITLMGAQL